MCCGFSLAVWCGGGGRGVDVQWVLSRCVVRLRQKRTLRDARRCELVRRGHFTGNAITRVGEGWLAQATSGYSLTRVIKLRSFDPTKGFTFGSDMERMHARLNGPGSQDTEKLTKVLVPEE